LLETVLVLVLAAHLLAANLAGAAPLISVWLDVRSRRRNDVLAAEVGRYLLRQSLLWLTAGLALGGLTLAIVYVGAWEPFAATVGRLPSSRFWWAGPELAFYYFCVAFYLWLWQSTDNSSPGRVVSRRMLGILAATNLLYHFPLLFTMIGVFASRPASGVEPLVFRHAMLDAEVFSQFVHHVFASFAVAGVAMMGYSLRLSRAGRSSEAQQVAMWGGRVALVPTVSQLIIGMYVLMQLPDRARSGLLGGDALATLLFTTSLFCAIVLMHWLAHVSAGDTERRKIIGTMALLVVVVVVMVGTRQRVRQERFVSMTNDVVDVARL